MKSPMHLWSAAERRLAPEFEKRTAGLVSQFGAYKRVPGANINGRQNLGEDIGDQRFFMSWAQVGAAW